MRKTLNYTGRKKIFKKEALFSFAEANGNGAPEFNVLWNIDASKFPENASIYVEAYYKETRQRFDFGIVGNIVPPSKRKLDQLDLSGSTLFDVLIVDESGRHGLLLGKGGKFSANETEDESNRSSILSVKAYDIGQQTWRLELEEGCSPVLYVNQRIPNGIERLRSDPLFQSLVLPAALRQVLTWYAWNDEDMEGDEHCAKWMAFAAYLYEEMPADSDDAAVRNWIDEVVVAFSEKFHLADMLTHSLQEDA